MGRVELNVGTKLTLRNRLTKAVLAAVTAGTLGLGLFMSSADIAVSGGETRTISLVHQHTKERLTVTYMKNGKYVPSAMKQLNRFFRDWRRNEVTKIDPRTIDLVWELHADLGSKKPIHVVSGYRSPKTNAFLKRIGRNVAKKSQHMKGRAIDFFFPDVSTKTIRNSAIARRVGGVGYYSSSGGPTGFIHADSGNVRAWGKKASPSEIKAAIRTIGKRAGKRGVFSGAPDTQLAEGGKKKSGGVWGWIRGDSNKPQVEAQAPEESAVAGVDDAAIESIYDTADLADLSEGASEATVAEEKAAQLKAKKPTPVAEPAPAPVVIDEPAFVEAAPDASVSKKDRGALAALAGTATTETQAEAPAIKTAFVPKPRLKPKNLPQIAAASLLPEGTVITPVAIQQGQRDKLKAKKPSPVVDPIGTVEAAETLIETDVDASANGKSDLDGDIRMTNVEELVTITEVKADDTPALKLRPSTIELGVKSDLMKNGIEISKNADTSAMIPAELGPDGSGEISIPAPVSTAEGKGDPQVVNHEGKSQPPRIRLKLSQAQ
jgi:uncharacterized protein YcbK (DUF882 family)